MKKVFFYLFTSTLLFSCGQGTKANEEVKDPNKTAHDSLLKAINAYQEKIQATMNAGALDMGLASQTVNAYQAFVTKFPTDTNTALFLFKSADLYTSAMKQFDMGVACLEKIIQDHPTFKKLPLCYFELGVIYDDNLNDDVKAKKYYEEFLKKFPDHKLAPQVQALISYLGKSNEDLLKEFEKKNPEKNGAGKK